MNSNLNNKTLDEISSYVNEKINISELDNTTYISTENMLSNKSGITKAATLPNMNLASAFNVGDILVSNIRPYFKKIWYASFDGGCSNDVLVFRVKQGVDSKFLYYVLSDDKFFNYSMATAKGTKMPRGDKKSLMEYSIPDIEFKTQQKIAKVLSAIDDKIELNNSINNNLERQAQAIFKSWFIDFEPFGGTMPKGWIEDNLGNFIEIKRGGSPRPIQNYISDSGYRWLKISDATAIQSPFILNIKEYIKESGINKTVFLKASSLVLSNSATPGLPKILDVDSCIHDGWLYFPESKLSNEYLYLLFKFIRPNLVALGNGSVFTNLKTDILRNYNTILPDKETLNRFDNIVGAIFKKILYNTRENERLTQLRDTLLPKLMSGEIDVDKVEII